MKDKKNVEVITEADIHSLLENLKETEMLCISLIDHIGEGEEDE